jgi:hypothetical protein
MPKWQRGTIFQKLFRAMLSNVNKSLTSFSLRPPLADRDTGEVPGSDQWKAWLRINRRPVILIESGQSAVKTSPTASLTTPPVARPIMPAIARLDMPPVRWGLNE